MKTYALAILLVITLAGCSRPASEPTILKSETILLCTGAVQSIIAGQSGQEEMSIKLTKIGDKVVSAKLEDATFTLEKLDISTPKNKGPIYLQLVVEPERIILRAEITEDKRVNQTTIENSGRYKSDRMFGWSEGTCRAAAKVF